MLPSRAVTLCLMVCSSCSVAGEEFPADGTEACASSAAAAADSSLVTSPLA